MSRASKTKREEKKAENLRRKQLKQERSKAKARAKTDVNKRLRDQEKELSTQTKAKRRARFAAKDVFNYIGYDALYKDGIAQVEDGLFSQTIRFSDISYQSAREENQQAIFSTYCQLFH